MLEILNGIKNNNVNKIPNYDPSHFEHLRKSFKSLLREGSFVTELNISYQDLIKVIIQKFYSKQIVFSRDSDLTSSNVRLLVS